MPKIFISYRRDDSAVFAGRISDRLASHFGRDGVFMDVDSIPFGVDFREFLSASVSKCDVLLALIGESWLNARESGGNGGRRLDNPRDFVRIEIEAALQRDIPVVPVLLGATTLPSENDLPSALAQLAYRNAAQVDAGRDFHAHMDRLIRGLEEHDLAKQGIDPAQVRQKKQEQERLEREKVALQGPVKLEIVFHGDHSFENNREDEMLSYLDYTDRLPRVYFDSKDLGSVSLKRGFQLRVDTSTGEHKLIIKWTKVVMSIRTGRRSKYPREATIPILLEQKGNASVALHCPVEECIGLDSIHYG